MTVQQEGHKTLQQIIRDQVVSEVHSIETTTSLNDEVKHWERKEATTARQHTHALELQAQHVIVMLNHMKEEGLPSEEIEVAAQVVNNAYHALDSWQSKSCPTDG